MQSKPVPVPDDIRRHLNLMVPAGIHEVRFLPTDKRPLKCILIQPGDVDTAVKKICDFNDEGYNCYVTLNPLNEAIRQSATAAKDAYVERRRWLYVDIDADKAVKARVMATDAEHDDALRRTYALAEQINFPEPVMFDSDNGTALLYRVDLPNDRETAKLLKGCLAAFNMIDPNVDGKVYNAGRFSRIVGTVNMKGRWVERDQYDDPTQWRPWRVARYLSVPEPIPLLGREQIEALAAKSASSSKNPASTSSPASTSASTSTSGGGGGSDEGFAKKLFWAMYFERYGDGVDGTERALSEGGFEVMDSDAEGVLIRSPLVGTYTTQAGEKDVKVYSPYLNLSVFHKTDEGAAWTWRDGMEYVQRYLPSFYGEYEDELANKARPRRSQPTASARPAIEEPEDDDPPLPEEDLIGRSCPLVFPAQGMPRFVMSVARMIQQRTPIVTDLGAFVAASQLGSMMLGKSVSFVQQGNRRYDSLTLIYTAQSGHGKSDLCRTMYRIATDLGIDVDQTNDINVPTFFKHYAKKVELRDGNKAQLQREIIDQCRQDEAVCLVIDEFRNFLDNMIGSRNSQQIGYASKLCNMLDDELILTYETRSGGNLWIGDPCIKVFGACVDSDLDILENDLIQRKGLSARMLVANENMLDARFRGKFVLTEADRVAVGRIARLARDVRYEVAFTDEQVEAARNAAVERVPYLRGTLNRLVENERQTLLSKAFTQSKKLAASWAVLGWLWGNHGTIDGFSLNHKTVNVDGGPWIGKAVALVLAFHCSAKNQTGLSYFAEARKIVLDYLRAKRGKANRADRRPSIILRNRKKLGDLGFRRLNDFRSLLELMTASGDIELFTDGDGRNKRVWYDALVTE